MSFAAPGLTGEAAAAHPQIKVMLLTGQSNRYHNWSLSSAILQRLLEQPGIFVVDKVLSPPMGATCRAFGRTSGNTMSSCSITKATNGPTRRSRRSSNT